MRFLVFLVLSAFAVASSAQGIYTDPKLYIGATGDNDTITTQDLLAADGISARAGDTRFSVMNFTVKAWPNGNEVVLSSSTSRFTEEMKAVFGKLPQNTKITISTKIKGRDAKARLSSMTVVVGKKRNGFFKFAAKLLKETIKMEALVNQEVMLKDTKGAVLKTAITDQFGDFEFVELSSSEQYSLELKAGPQLDKGKIYLAQRNGTIITELTKGVEGTFTYRVLPQEINKLEMLAEEDPMLQLSQFKIGTKKEITVAENILYETGSAQINPDAAQKLDKVAAALLGDLSLILELTAHTDARGDDKKNMELSEARAKAAVAYLLSKGIAKERVSGKGAGESKLLNRCLNDVNCSEEEHRLNRRTEFRFVKK